MQEGPRTTVGRRSLRRQCAGPRPPLRGAIGAAGQPRTAARTRNRRTSPEARMRPGRRGQGTQLRATEVTGPTSPGGERRGESRALDPSPGHPPQGFRPGRPRRRRTPSAASRAEADWPRAAPDSAVPQARPYLQMRSTAGDAPAPPGPRCSCSALPLPLAAFPLQGPPPEGRGRGA